MYLLLIGKFSAVRFPDQQDKLNEIVIDGVSHKIVAKPSEGTGQ